MNKKSIGILIAVTLLIVVSAVFIAQRRQSATSDTQIGAPFFTGLEAKANDIATVEIVRGKDAVTIQREGDAWRVKEKGGYPADVELLKPLVLSISGLRTVEAKTSKADQYGKIGVADPSGENAVHPGVTFKDAAGNTLASLVIGETRESDDGLKKMLYVRRLNEAQAWLVEGQVEVVTDAIAWLRKDKVLDVFRSRIKSYSIMLPEGDRYLIARDTKDDKGFKYLPPPRNAKIRSQARLDDMSAALENVVPDDVYVADAVEFSQSEAAHNEYRTFDGLIVKTSLLQKDGRWLAKYDVSFDATATATQPQGKADVAVQTKQETETLGNKLRPWVFVIPEAKAALMTKKSTDVLEPLSR